MNTFVTLCVALAALAVPARAQIEMQDPKTAQYVPSFDVDAITFASDSSSHSRLDIFAAIPYEQLSFVRESDHFVASYEMTIGVYDSSTALVAEKLWTREVKTPSFDQSVSPSSFSVEQVSLNVKPGRYQVSVLCRDIESRVSRRVSKQLTISDFSAPGMHMSDIMLISKLAERDGKKSITPSISPNVGYVSGPFHIFFETYNPDGRDSTRYVASVLNEKKEPVLSTDTVYVLRPGRNQLFIRIDHSSLPIGDYTLYVQAFPLRATDEGKALSSTSRSFIIRWSGMPRSMKDLDLAVDQLTYIAKDKELSHIKDAENAEEKQKRFMEFWKKRDPNPNTPRNEKMEEYYGRVEYANKNFKHYIDGWRTDMGMVYIMFGTPSNVDRHPFDIDSKPYEVWSYYDLNYSFVFVDQTGFGDYRLITPLWEVWQRTSRN